MKQLDTCKTSSFQFVLGQNEPVDGEKKGSRYSIGAWFGKWFPSHPSRFLRSGGLFTVRTLGMIVNI